MCGKFTAMASWSEVLDFSQPLSLHPEAGANDRPVTFRVMGNLPVIVWDREGRRRRVVPMRWGFPHPQDWRRPQPIHARAETIDTVKAFSGAFREGQRGIVLMNTFNEAPDVEGPTIQHTITPGEDSALAAAFVWRRFELSDVPMPMLACVLATVPANRLISTLPTDRMPAFIAPEDWGVWLGEVPSTVEQAKACLRTVDGVRWVMIKEAREAKLRTKKPIVSNPTGSN